MLSGSARPALFSWSRPRPGARLATVSPMSRAVVMRGALATLVLVLFAPIPLSSVYPVDNTWYWAISWDHGFVRRGLCGELAQLVAPGDLVSGALTMSQAAAFVAGLVVLAVGLRLVVRGTPASVGLGLAVALSPVGVGMMWTDPRPELFGYPALAFVAGALRLGGRSRDALVLLAGLLLAVVTLMSENVLLAIVPWAILLVLVGTAEEAARPRVRMLAVLLGLPVLTGLVVVAAGRASPAQVAALSRDAYPLPNHATGFMDFVGQDFLASVRYVGDSGLAFRFQSAASTAVALVVVAVAVAIAGGVHEVRRLPRSRLLAWAFLLPVVALVLQAAGGIDWPRWLGQQGGGALLTLGLWSLVRPEPEPPPWSRRWVAGVAVGTLVLVLMPSVPDLLLRHDLVGYWFSRVDRWVS
jgi:hypothetical protein